jgi:hypothetical protein
MSANLELMRKIANQKTTRNAIHTLICTSKPKAVKFQEAINYETKRLPIANCDPGLDQLFDSRDWFEDTWWRHR